MPTLQQSIDIDTESASSNNEVTADGGGGSDHRQIAAVTENEIVGAAENKGNSTDKHERRESNVSECSVEIGDLETRVLENKVHLGKTERDCRICHLSMDAADQDCGLPIELGCSCKDDLAAAHEHCAEAWFKIKGNKTCEICGSIARNVGGLTEAELSEEWNEAGDGGAATAMATPPLSESRNFWRGHKFLNFLLACMVFAFVISWLFHFNVPS